MYMHHKQQKYVHVLWSQYVKLSHILKKKGIKKNDWIKKLLRYVYVKNYHCKF